MQSSASSDLVARLRDPGTLQVFLRHRVRMAFLFGSRSRGEETPGSDLDVAVLLPESWGKMERLEAGAGLSSELRRSLCLPVDVVVLNEANPILRFEAVIRGITVFGPDTGELHRYEMQVRDRYEDFRHIQGFYVAALKRRLGAKP